MREYQYSDCRYGDCLEAVLERLGGVKNFIKLDFTVDYQGHCDMVAELNDGRVFVYDYYYGSCSGCDEWENRNLTEKEVEEEMLSAAVIYDSVEQFEASHEG